MFHLYWLVLSSINANLAFASNNGPKEIGSSPFEWSIWVGDKEYPNRDINQLFKSGLEFPDKDVKCRLDFSSDWDRDSPFAKKYGATYTESLSVSCNVKEVKLYLPGISCTDSKSHDSEWETLNFTLASKSIRIHCAHPPKNGK